MMKRGIFLFTALLTLVGCRHKDLSDYPGYVDSKHVRLFAYPGEWWEGHDVAEMPDGRYVASGVRDFAGDNMKTAIVMVGPSGDSLGVYYLPHRGRGTNIVPIDNGRVAVKDRHGLHILSVPDGIIEKTIDLGYNREISSENDVIVYDGRTGSFVLLWGSDDGLCLRQVFLDGSDGWMACSGINALLGGMKIVGDGYVAFGPTMEGVLIFKVDTSGDTLWVRHVRLPFADGLGIVEAYGLEVAENGDILISGQARDLVPFVARIDTSGNLIWLKYYEHPGDSLEWFRGYGTKIIKIGKNRYVLEGKNIQCPASSCIGFVKINGNGNVIMARNFFWGVTHHPYNVIRTNDGNLLIVGISGMDSTDYFFLFKIDPDGNPVW